MGRRPQDPADFVELRTNQQLLRMASVHGYQPDGSGYFARNGERAACHACQGPIAVDQVAGLFRRRGDLAFLCWRYECTDAILARRDEP